jgi:hypothetical protein
MTNKHKFHFIKTKLSFRKDPRPTGLFAVGHPQPGTTIKIDGKEVGYIAPPTWQTRDIWTIRFMVKDELQENPNCDWKWVTFKTEFATEPEAREFIRQNLNRILDRYILHSND